MTYSQAQLIIDLLRYITFELGFTIGLLTTMCIMAVIRTTRR